MVITFVSNYINHHQIPFCMAMDRADEVEFHFIQTQEMEAERVKMGWGVDTTALSYVTLFYEEEDKAKRLIADSDAVIFGWGHDIELERERLEAGKLTFKLSERIYREGQWKAISPKGLINKYKEHIRFRNKSVFLLCAGAYVASDYNLIHAYPGKKYKWGYFTECKKYTIDELQHMKSEDKLVITWTGRLIKLKHPEFAVKLATKLKSKNIDFEMNIIGDGDMKSEVSDMIDSLGVSDVVRLQGFMEPSKVRIEMEKSDIFLFTSNYLEGWGAVVGEAMNSRCAVIASKEAGAVPFLIDDGINGITYSNGSYKDFEQKAVKFICKKVNGRSVDKSDILMMGDRAYETILNSWNADTAAERLIRFCRTYLNNGEVELPVSGPLSRAEVVKAPGFKRTMQEDNHLQ